MTSDQDEGLPPGCVVLVDANVLYSRVLRDYLLYASAEGAFEVRWSAEILAEVVEHLAANVVGFDAEAGARLIAAMNSAFPAASVEPDPGAVKLVSRLELPDEDDRHALAAAVAVGADVLCTDNLRDFPRDVMDQIGIRLMSADVLLSRLISEFPRELLAAHRISVSRLAGATDRSALAALRRAGTPKSAVLLSSLIGVLFLAPDGPA